MTGPARQPGQPHDRRPERRAGGRSAVRTGFSWLLWAVTAALAIGGIAGLASSSGGGVASHASAAYLFLVALFTGTGARAVATGGRRAPRPGAGRDGQDWPATGTGTGPVPPVLPARDADPAGPAWTERDLRHGRRAAGAHPAHPARPGPAGPPVNPQARYAERASNLPVIGAVIGGALLAAGLAGLIAIGGPNGPGAGASGAIFLLLALVSACYVLFLLIDLPNGILIAGGRFAVGVRGVPPAGRMWRRIQGPLDAVRSWEVLSPDQARQLRQQRMAERRAGRRRQYLGDLRLFGRRGVLRLQVDQGAVQASLPARILLGYAFVDAAAAGAIWEGTILIGTRRPAALAAALEQAMPGRHRG
jgi:hypothetical protein